MIFAFLSILCYKKVWIVDTKTKVTHIEDFGFEIGGSLSVSLSAIESKNIFYVITSESEDQLLQHNISYGDTLCAVGENNLTIFDIEHHSKITRNVTSKQVLFFKLVNCGYEQNDVTKLTVIHRFSNPMSAMDYRWQGITSVKKFFVVCFVVLFMMWIVNWVMHFGIQIWIHYGFTATFTIIAAMNIIRLVELTDLDKNDISVVWTPVRITAEVFAAAVFCITILLAAKGWCILRDELGLKEVIASIAYSVFFIVLVTIARYVHLGTAELAVWVGVMFFVVLFVRELIVSINDASLHILAHLLAISNAGIEAKSTPVYRKHLMYRLFEWTIIGGFVLVLIKICVHLFVRLDFWISESLNDAIILTVLTALALIFRLRNTTVSGYANMNPQDADGVDELVLSDIESLNVNSEEINRSGRKWEEGMPLPGMPNIVQKAEEEESVIVLAGPDGTDTVSAVVTSEIEA